MQADKSFRLRQSRECWRGGFLFCDAVFFGTVFTIQRWFCVCGNLRQLYTNTLYSLKSWYNCITKSTLKTVLAANVSRDLTRYMRDEEKKRPHDHACAPTVGTLVKWKTVKIRLINALLVSRMNCLPKPKNSL